MVNDSQLHRGHRSRHVDLRHSACSRGEIAVPFAADGADSSCAPARLIVVTDALFLGEALAKALETHYQVSTVLCAKAAAAISVPASQRADALLIDAAHAEGLTVTRWLRQLAPGLSIIAYGVRENDADVILWAEAGATGYIPNTVELSVVSDQIADILAGEQACSARAAAALFRRISASGVSVDATHASAERSLTRRERQVAELIAARLSDKEIARELKISLATAKTHVHNLLGKLAATRRGEVSEALLGSARLLPPRRMTTPPTRNGPAMAASY